LFPGLFEASADFSVLFSEPDFESPLVLAEEVSFEVGSLELFLL
jgi:hypothetical protein